MKTAYQESLQNWVSKLTNEQISDYMGMLDRFNDEEVDALLNEDVRRMQAA
jgi:hypothetical protein